MKFKQKLKYKFENFLSMGTFSLILTLFLITFVAVVLVGIIASFAQEGEGTLHVIWISFMQTLDAGNLSDAEGTFWYVFLMTISTITGVFVTSLLISFVSNGFQSKLENLQKGASSIVEKNHTLILGYNENVPVIVGELIQANLSRKRPVVAILCDKDLMEVQSDLHEKLKKFQNTKIIVRTGSIFDKDNLIRCGIETCRNVILSTENDAETIKAILAIRQTAFCHEDHQGYITTIIHQKSNIDVARSISSKRLVMIHLGDAMNRIMAQSCLQPGLSFVYKDVFDFSGDEFYFYPFKPSMIGTKFGQWPARFEDSVVVGIVRNHEVLLNPDAETPLMDGDQLVLISEDDDTMIENGQDSHRFESMIVSKPHRDNRIRRHILSIGWNESTLSVMKEMEPYVKDGSRITFLVPNVDMVQGQEAIDFMKCDIQSGDFTSYDVLSKIDYSDIDTVVIFGSCSDEEESDAQTLLTVLHLRRIEKERGKDLQIVIEIKVNRNAETLQFASIDDFVVSNVLSNKMLSQISENRYLSGLFEELLSPEGNELYLKKASDYVKLHETVDFYAVVESAIRKQEIAIGYKKKGRLAKGGVVVNPDKSETLTFEEGDQVIVIAQD